MQLASKAVAPFNVRCGFCQDWLEQGDHTICSSRELQDSKTKVFAKDMVKDVLYVNFERVPRMMRLVAKSGETGPAGREPERLVRVLLYSEYHKEWIEISIPEGVVLDRDLDRLSPERKAPPPPSPEERAAKAAHLAQFKKVRAELVPEAAQPDKCIVGQIGPNKVLVDAGDGSVVGTFNPNGFIAADEAKKLGRTLVGQKEATAFALTTLRRAWADAKAKGL